MTGTGKKQKKNRADSCLSACWSKQFRLSCYWIPPPSPMLLVSCRFLPFDVKALAPFHFDSHEAVPSIHFESLHISAAEQRCRVDRRRGCPPLTSIVVIFFFPKVTRHCNYLFVSFDILAFVSRQCNCLQRPLEG